MGVNLNPNVASYNISSQQVAADDPAAKKGYRLKTTIDVAVDDGALRGLTGLGPMERPVLKGTNLAAKDGVLVGYADDRYLGSAATVAKTTYLGVGADGLEHHRIEIYSADDIGLQSVQLGWPDSDHRVDLQPVAPKQLPPQAAHATIEQRMLEPGEEGHGKYTWMTKVKYRSDMEDLFDAFGHTDLTPSLTLTNSIGSTDRWVAARDNASHSPLGSLPVYGRADSMQTREGAHMVRYDEVTILTGDRPTISDVGMGPIHGDGVTDVLGVQVG